MYLYLLFARLLFALSGSDRKFKSSLDRCAPVLRGSNKCVCVGLQVSVWMCRVCGGKGGSYFGTVQTEMGPNPKRMQIGLSTHTHTHTFKSAPKCDKKNFWSGYVILTFHHSNEDKHIQLHKHSSEEIMKDLSFLFFYTNAAPPQTPTHHLWGPHFLRAIEAWKKGT